MDLTESIAPKSDQLNAEDLLAGPRTFTISKVGAGNPEQPVNVHLVELPGRAYRPSKSMRRLMVAAWGKDSAAYTGRRVTLYRNPEIRFGKDVVGGIEISHLSHIDKPLTVALTVTRGKRKNFTVAPLNEPKPVEAKPEEYWLDQIDGCNNLRALWNEAKSNGASEETLAAIFAAAQPAPHPEA